MNIFLLPGYTFTVSFSHPPCAHKYVSAGSDYKYMPSQDILSRIAGKHKGRQAERNLS